MVNFGVLCVLPTFVSRAHNSNSLSIKATDSAQPIVPWLCFHHVNFLQRSNLICFTSCFVFVRSPLPFTLKSKFHGGDDTAGGGGGIQSYSCFTLPFSSVLFLFAFYSFNLVFVFPFVFTGCEIPKWGEQLNDWTTIGKWFVDFNLLSDCVQSLGSFICLIWSNPLREKNC